jgi:hypothetical protein
VEKIKLLDKGNIELPKNVLETFRFEKGMEFNLFFDSDRKAKTRGYRRRDKKIQEERIAEF